MQGDENIRKLGGSAAILLGVSYLVVGVAYALLPSAQRGNDLDAFLRSAATTRGAYLTASWALAIGALLALAAVPAVTDLVAAGNEGWAGWAGKLAYLGFAVTALEYTRHIALVPIEADAYVRAGPTLRAVIRTEHLHLRLDPYSWLSFGAIGVWVLIVSVLALRRNTLPVPLGTAGLALAAAYWLAVVGQVLDVPALVGVAAVAGGIVLAPVFYIAVGARLRSGPVARGRQ